MKQLIAKCLKQVQENNKLITIRTNTDDADKFNVGYILNFNDEFVTVKSINAQGLPFGVFTIKISDIYGVDMNDNYLRKLELKMLNLKTVFADTPSPSFYADPIIDFRKILLNAKSQLQMINVNFYRDLGIYGFVKEVGEEEFMLDVFNTDGIYDGVSVYLIEDIKNIYWDDEDIRMINLLIEKK